jgi:hypothetical protein
MTDPAPMLSMPIWPPSRSLKCAPTAAGVLVATSTASLVITFCKISVAVAGETPKTLIPVGRGSCRILCIRSVAGNIVVDDDVARKVLSWGMAVHRHTREPIPGERVAHYHVAIVLGARYRVENANPSSCSTNRKPVGSGDVIGDRVMKHAQRSTGTGYWCEPRV